MFHSGVKQIVLLAISLFMYSFSGGQSKGVCGFDEVRKYQLKDPAFAEKDRQIQMLIRARQEELQRKRSIYGGANIQPGGMTEIPVVVHVINKGGAIGDADNPSDNAIENMITQLNTLFGSNAGTSIPLRFALAKRNPAGCDATNGINRINFSSNLDYKDHGVQLPGNNVDGLDDNTLKNLSRWPGTQYFNIWVVWKINASGLSPGTFIAGYYSRYAMNDQMVLSDMDGIVLHANQVNSTSTSLAHEMGHALDLLHTFEGGSSSACPPNNPLNCANEGDRICDTEPIKNLLGVPLPDNTVTNSCTGALYNNTQYNIMGYGSPLNRFTSEQSTRASSSFDVLRLSLRTSLGSVAPPGSLVQTASPPSGITHPGTYTNAGPCNVTLNELEYVSMGNHAQLQPYYYIDNTCNLGTHLSAGNSYQLKVTTQTNLQYCKVWIDFDNSGGFSSSEEVLTNYSNTANYTHTVTVTPAMMLGATKNTPLRMRVTADISTITDATSNLNYGQAEDFWVIIEPALPVVFRSLEAITGDNKVQVNWTVEKESNNDHFDIELSKDGVNFVKIGEMVSKAPSGNSADPIQYHYTSDISAVMGVLGGLLFSVLLMLLSFHQQRNNWARNFLVVFAIGLILQASCTKKDDAVSDRTKNEKMYFRIAQVDKNGVKTYSRIVQAVSKDE